MRLERRPRKRRLLDLAPLVDVVFLLIVFFMLATRFDQDRALPLAISGAAAPPTRSEEPMQVELLADGRLRLDGEPIDLESLALRFAARADLHVALHPEAEVPLSRIHGMLELAIERGVAGASLVRSF